MVHVYLLAALAFGTLESLDSTNDGDIVTITFDQSDQNDREYLHLSVQLPSHPSLNPGEKQTRHDLIFKRTNFTRLRTFTFQNSTDVTEFEFGSEHFYTSDEVPGSLYVVKGTGRQYKVRGHFCIGAVKISISSAEFGDELEDITTTSVQHVKLSKCDADISVKFENLPSYGFPHRNLVHVNQRNRRHVKRHVRGRRQNRHISGHLKKSRLKRVPIETYTVELLIVIDYEAYKRWDQLFSLENNVDTLEKIKQYYSYIFNGIDSRFRSIENQNPAINMALAGFIIAQSEEDSFWTSSSTIEDQVVVSGQRLMINASEALEKFQTWLDEDTAKLPQYDHAILFTGGDLTYAGNTGNTGLAFAESMCRNISNSSIVEEAFDFRTVTYSTQQIARSLGARDDMDNNDCLEFFNFIMAPKFKLPVKSFPENRWKFSECTVQYFTDYISKIKEDGLNCIQETPIENRYPEEVVVLIQELPGTIYTAQQQCQNILGPQSDICRARMKPSAYAKLCTGLLCTIPGSDDCNYILPAEGTPCGNMKYCFEGQCLEFDDAEKGLDNCAFGDDPNAECIRRISNKPFLCYTESVRYSCCASCAKVEIGLAGCEYGDRTKTCLVEDCKVNNDSVKDTMCCRTCADGPVPDLPSTDDWFTVSTSTTKPTTGIPTTLPQSTFETFTDVGTSFNTVTTEGTLLVTSSDGSKPSSSSQTLSDITTASSSKETTESLSSPLPSTNTSPSSLTMTTQPTTVPTQIPSSSPTQTTQRQTTTTYRVDLSTSSSMTSYTTVSTIPNVPNTEPATTPIVIPTSQSSTGITPSTKPSAIDQSVTVKSSTTIRVGQTTTIRPKPPHYTTRSGVSLHTADPIKEYTTQKPETNVNTEPCVTEAKLNRHQETVRPTGTLPNKLVLDCAKICQTNKQPSVMSGHRFNMYDRMFFKELARSMRQNQRRIQQRVQSSIKHLYLGITRQIRRHQESDTESIIYNDVVNPRLEVPSQDDDDINRLLIPVWRRQHNTMLRNVERDVKHMRYKVLMMVNRHLRH